MLSSFSVNANPVTELTKTEPKSEASAAKTASVAQVVAASNQTPEATPKTPTYTCHFNIEGKVSCGKNDLCQAYLIAAERYQKEMVDFITSAYNNTEYKPSSAEITMLRLLGINDPEHHVNRIRNLKKELSIKAVSNVSAKIALNKEKNSAECAYSADATFETQPKISNNDLELMLKKIILTFDSVQ